MHYFYLSMKCQILILSFFTSVLATHGQTILFRYTNETNQVYDLETLSKFTFTSDSITLHMTSGMIYSWHLDSINYYQYQEEGLVTAVPDKAPNTLPSINLYPNPSTGSITIEYTLDLHVPVRFEILSTDGRIVARSNFGMQHPGQHSFHWDGIDGNGQALPTGMYICNIISPHIRMTRTFVIY